MNEYLSIHFSTTIMCYSSYEMKNPTFLLESDSMKWFFSSIQGGEAVMFLNKEHDAYISAYGSEKGIQYHYL